MTPGDLFDVGIIAALAALVLLLAALLRWTWPN
jgi:hypothetical protein